MLSPRCQSSGYGIVLQDGKFLKFDAAGSAKALKLLKAMTKDTDLKATVTGTLKRDVYSGGDARDSIGPPPTDRSDP